MNPYNRNFGWYQQPDPIRRPYTHTTTSYPTNTVQRPKVVQIPVQFVNSEPVDRSVFALKIQKVLRGFLVRKNMKRIKDVKKQVDEIGDKLSRCEEVVDSIRSNEKERLRISETLMSLLFKLDSIRGVDLGVRDCRKSVIRKAIALQERIDAIVAVDFGNDAEIETTEVQEPEIGANQSDNDVELGESEEKLEDVISNGGNDEENDETIVDVGVDCEVKVNEGKNSANTGVDSVEEESMIENDGKNSVGDWVEVKESDGDDNKSNRNLLEKMVEDNEKMMSMMAQLFERNEKQMTMLTALTHRVEHLEKAFLCEKLSRKKKMKKMRKDHSAACEED